MTSILAVARRASPGSPPPGGSTARSARPAPAPSPAARAQVLLRRGVRLPVLQARRRSSRAGCSPTSSEPVIGGSITGIAAGMRQAGLGAARRSRPAPSALYALRARRRRRRPRRRLRLGAMTDWLPTILLLAPARRGARRLARADAARVGRPDRAARRARRDRALDRARHAVRLQAGRAPAAADARRGSATCTSRTTSASSASRCG